MRDCRFKTSGFGFDLRLAKIIDANELIIKLINKLNRNQITRFIAMFQLMKCIVVL
jgi:hypothetical protein